MTRPILFSTEMVRAILNGRKKEEVAGSEYHTQHGENAEA